MNIMYKMVKCIGYPIFKLLYRPKVIGKENIPNRGPVVLAGNHTSNFDCATLICSNKRIIHFLGKKELFNKGIGNWFFTSMGTIPVDRSRKNPNAINEALKVLNNKQIIGIFPEGTTRKNKGEILPFKFGAVSLAKKSNALIVPFSITGEYKIFGNNLVIRYGKAYKIKDDDLAKENELLRNKVIKLIGVSGEYNEQK